MAPKHPVEQLPECLWCGLVFGVPDIDDADEVEDTPDVPEVADVLEQLVAFDMPYEGENIFRVVLKIIYFVKK